MRIALVVPGGVDRSGEYRVIPALLSLIARLSREHEVHVFALNQERDPARWTLAGACIHNVGARATRRRALQAILAQHRLGRFDLIHAFWSGPCGLLAVLGGLLLRIPSVVHVAGGELVRLPGIDYGGLRSWRSRLRETWVLRRASVVTAASEPMLRSVAALGVRARRVPLGADLELWVPRPPRARTSLRARLIHVASLNRVKDQATLLRAAAELARQGAAFELDIVGEDTIGGEMQRLARQLELAGRVRFHGFLPQRAVRPLMEMADLLLISSCHEAGPIVVLEAAALGVPTVGTRVGHIAEWAPEAALAVPVGDAQALAAAAGALLDDEDLRMRLARAAQARAISEDAAYTARSFMQIYAELLAQPYSAGVAPHP